MSIFSKIMFLIPNRKKPTLSHLDLARTSDSPCGLSTVDRLCSWCNFVIARLRADASSVANWASWLRGCADKSCSCNALPEVWAFQTTSRRI